jgi:hypothetical protein
VAEQGLQGCSQPLLVGGGGPAAVTGEISVDARAGQDEDHVNRPVVGRAGRGRQEDQAARFITVHTPGGFEGFHTAAAAAEEQKGEPLGVPELIGLASKFDWQLAGPPLLPTGQLAGPAS